MIELTERQAEIRDLLVTNLTAKEIGARLGISNRTVEKLSETIRKKYGARNRYELICTILQGTTK